MPYSKLMYWVQYVPIIEARKQLRALEVSAYPNMKVEDRKRVKDLHYKKGVPLELDTTKIHTTEELAIRFKEAMNGK